MRPKLQKQSELKLAGRIIPGAHRGKTSYATFEALVELSQERSDAGVNERILTV